MFIVYMITEVGSIRIAKFSEHHKATDFADRQPFSTLVDFEGA